MPRLLRPHPDEIAELEQQRKEREQVAAAENARFIAKRERELDALEAKLRVDPPPELSPKERRERELVERIERLEGSQSSLPLTFSREAEQHRHDLVEDLRRRRERRDLQEREERERQAGIPKRVAKWDSREKAIIDRRVAALEAERKRHETALAEIHQRADSEKDELGPCPTLEDLEQVSA